MQSLVRAGLQGVISAVLTLAQYFTGIEGPVWATAALVSKAAMLQAAHTRAALWHAMLGGVFARLLG